MLKETHFICLFVDVCRSMQSSSTDEDTDSGEEVTCPVCVATHPTPKTPTVLQVLS